MSACRGCGKEIVFAKNPDTGRLIPLDAKALCYRVVEEVPGQLSAYRAKDCMVTHFATCPDAKDFSGSGKS